MLRLTGAVIVGYIAMALAVFAGLTAAYLVMGADRAFQPGVYTVSSFWVVTSFAVGFAAALLGGWTARRVAHTDRGPWVLAGLVVVLGLAMAVPALFGAPAADALRTGTVGVFDAMQVAQTPGWIMALNPFVGALGVLLGGGVLRRAGRGAGRDDARMIEPAV